MKTIIFIAVCGMVALVCQARMNAFTCSGECFAYDEGPFCMSDSSGSLAYVACNNCIQKKKECYESLTAMTSCSSPCTNSSEIGDIGSTIIIG